MKDILERLEYVTGPWQDFTLAEDAKQEIERLRIENIQLKFACGYPMPTDLEKHIVPSNPFRCGACDARNR